MSADLSEALAEVDPGRRADVALDHLTTVRAQWRREHRRPRAFSTREALLALKAEAAIVWIVGCDMRAGLDVSPKDWDRFVIALRRIDAIVKEAAE